MLCEKPMYGYEIEKAIEDRNMRYWTEVSFFSIYRLLKKLEGKGLAESEIRLGKNNVSQKVYSVTGVGRMVTKGKIMENISEAERIICRVDLSVANISLLTKEEAVGCLRRYVASLDGMIGDYDALESFFRAHGYPETDLALAIRPRMHLITERVWAIDFLSVIGRTEL
ncbi:MAG TPA: helix-turn-helix transcriptional regulator [Methanocella sp.]|nr:helix-turn-helix transcriptional regulator [Methanocella sp.]